MKPWETDTLTIGGLCARFVFAPGARESSAWEVGHCAFLSSDGINPAAEISVHPGVAPASHEGIEALAGGGLWTLTRDPRTDRRRLDIRGGPQGILAMTLELSPSSESLPLTGTLWLGPPPENEYWVPLGYPLTLLLWTLLLGRLPAKSGGLLCHACGVRTSSGDGLLFPGFSGAGKSTTSRLWRVAVPGATILSDDRTILRREGDHYFIYGTPWCGEAGEACAERAPLKKILILGRSPDGVTTRTVPLSPALAATHLLARTTPPIWDWHGTEAALAFAAGVSASLPISRWDFAPCPEAILSL